MMDKSSVTETNLNEQSNVKTLILNFSKQKAENPVPSTAAGRT